MNTLVEDMKKFKAEAEGLIACDDEYNKAFGDGMLKVIDHILSEDSKKQRRIDKASDILCEGDEDDGGFTIEEQIKAIEKYVKEDDGDTFTFIDDIEGVIVWENLEYKLKCKDFLNLISDYE
jgi:KaiC/GvpD/RAD55 family RecA-like ATPase